MSEIRRRKRPEEQRQAMPAEMGQRTAKPAQRNVTAAQPAVMPEAEVRPVRDAAAEASFQGGSRMAAQSISAAATGREDMGPEQAQTRIGREDVLKAMKVLNKYKAGKASVDNRIIRAQEWWKLRNWEMIREERGTQGATEQKSATAWLWYSIVTKHADMMDSFPEPVILPRMAEDKDQAQILSEVIPVVLKQNKFADTYDKTMWQKLQEGTGCYHVGWDKSKMGGIGDISITNVNLLQIFWEPGVEDIQESENLFFTRLMDNRRLEQMYPQLEGKLKGAILVAKKYRTDDSVDTSEKSVVVDWYYHRWDGGKKILHYCQFVSDQILYATENDPEAQNGLYDDGEYPFVFDPLYTVKGSPAGYGYIDIGKDCQTDVDTINQAMVVNSVVTSTPRYFVQSDGGINEEEFADLSKPFVHCDGSLGEQSLRQIETTGIQGNAMSMYDRKIEELKYITSNTDVNNGATPNGVTAASAIAALQETSGRTSKDTNRGNYLAFDKVTELVISRLRQFYTAPRYFRILGQNGQEQFVRWSNAEIQAQQLEGGMGMMPGMRQPVFDIDVRSQRESAYTTMSQNELAIQFNQMGVFNPQMTDQSLMMLDMMDFKGKEELMTKLQAMGTLQDSLMQIAQIAMALAQKYDPAVAQQLAAVLQGLTTEAGMIGQNQDAKMPAGMPGSVDPAEAGKPSDTSSRVRNARAQVENSTRV